MYAVIFRAEIAELDDEYLATAEALRQLAFDQFGCLDFVASAENGLEIAVSHWPSLEHIQAWKNHPTHRRAQELGRTRWYKHYRVQVVEVLRDYGA